MIATRAGGWLVLCSLGCSIDSLICTSEHKNETEEVCGNIFLLLPGFGESVLVS